MPSIITNKLKEANIQNFIKTIDEESVYISFGRSTEWINQNAPPAPKDNYPLLRSFFFDQLYMKKINIGNVSRVAKLYKWIPNTRYQEFSSLRNIEELCEPKVYAPATAVASISDGQISQITVINSGSGYESSPVVTISGGGGSGASAQAIVVDGIVSSIALSNKGTGFTSIPTIIIDPPTNISTSTFTVQPYYVITDDLQVYACMNNNNMGLSTIKPTHTTTNESDSGTSYADGYSWKYLYKVTQNEAEKFMTANWFPVKNLSENDSSDNWSIQNNTFSNNRIHGYDIPYALNATTLMCKVRVNGDESGNIISSNDYRKISMILNPIAVNSIYTASSATSTTIVLNSSHDISNSSAVWYPAVGKKIKILSGVGRGQIRTITAFNAGTKEATVDKAWTVVPDSTSTYGIVLSTQVSNLCTILTLSASSGTFQEDDDILQTGGGAGKVVWFNSSSTPQKIYVTQVSTQFTSSGTVSAGAATGTTSGVILPDAADYPVDVLFTENRKRILRYTDQIEDVKILIQF